MSYNPGPIVNFPDDVIREFKKIAAEFLAIQPPPLEPVPAPDLALWRWGATSVAPFGIQAKEPSRVSVVQAGGRSAVRLLTLPGDSNLFGSGAMERCDLRLSNELTNAKEGQEHRWAHSVWFPDDYMELPMSTTTWNSGLVFNFHNSADLGGQANAQLLAMPPTATSPDRPVGLHFQIYGGDPARPTVGQYPIGPIIRNVWLNFVYHMRWTSTSSGFFSGWLDGRQFMAHKGPTLYTGQEAYLKLANYHTAHGKPSAVLHGPAARERA